MRLTYDPGKEVPVPDTIDRAKKLIQDRLQELESEAANLNQTLANLRGGSNRRTKPRSSGSKKQASRKGNRAKRGQRQEQFLKALREQPGARPSEIAAKMGVSQSQIHGLAGRLQKAGEITKSGKGYKVKKGNA